MKKGLPLCQNKEQSSSHLSNHRNCNPSSLLLHALLMLKVKTRSCLSFLIASAQLQSYCCRSSGDSTIPSSCASLNSSLTLSIASTKTQAAAPQEMSLLTLMNTHQGLLSHWCPATGTTEPLASSSSYTSYSSSTNTSADLLSHWYPSTSSCEPLASSCCCTSLNPSLTKPAASAKTAATAPQNICQLLII